MSKFNIFRDVPVEQMALRSEIANRSGHHFYFQAFFNKTAYHQENYGWSMIYYDGLTPKLKNVTNYIHSIHCTIETDAGDSPWDWNSLFWNRPVPLHTWVTYTLRVHTDNPPDLYITIGGQTSYFTIRGVKRGQLLMYTVRLFTNGYLVANDFNPNKKYSFLKVDNPDYIKATFGERVDIFKVEAMMPEVSIS
ncbi:uncharacterized protein LOC144104987 isoform X2 [Amblyomma americanum]